MDEIVMKFDRTAPETNHRLFRTVNDLHMFLEELSSRIDRLRNECPVAWSREEFEKSPRAFHFQKEWKERDISPAELEAELVIQKRIDGG